jgi:outer membrane protein with beta-barrel domain
MSSRVWVVGVLLWAASPVMAETDPFGDFGLLTGSVDSVVSRREGIGTRGWGANVGVGLRMNDVARVGIEASAQYISDNNSFTQLTTAGNFRSKTTLYDIAPYVGGRAPVGNASVGANVGYSLIFGTRTIENCIDCFSEDLNVDGGLYVEPAVAFGKPDRLQFGAAFRLYLGGDAKSMILLKVTRPF